MGLWMIPAWVDIVMETRKDGTITGSRDRNKTIWYGESSKQKRYRDVETMGRKKTRMKIERDREGPGRDNS
jgi:hypothetical protein